MKNEEIKEGSDVAVVFRAAPFASTMMGGGMARLLFRFVAYCEAAYDNEVRQVRLRDMADVEWVFPLSDIYLSHLPDGFIEEQAQLQREQMEAMALRRNLGGAGPFSQ